MPTQSHVQRVAANVRAEMARRQATQSSLARALGTSQQALSRRLSGEVDFTVGELFDIAEQFDIDIDVLTDLHQAKRAAS